MKTMTAVRTIMKMTTTQIDENNYADFRNAYIRDLAFSRIQVLIVKTSNEELR